MRKIIKKEHWGFSLIQKRETKETKVFRKFKV